MLVLSRRVNEEILIGNNIRVIVIEIKDHKVRLAIEAPPDVAVDRPNVRRAKERKREP